MHSDASVMDDEWYTRFFGCPESHADPLRQYELCKLRGMTLVAPTDHDTIQGGLRLLDRPDFFLSEEVTTRLPENGCVMHVLVWNIEEAHHAELQRRRSNIYELTRYLRESCPARRGLLSLRLGSSRARRPRWCGRRASITTR